MEGFMDEYINLQKVLGYKFQNIDLLRRALTHSSWANENKNLAPHNERQEFLGDAVLEVCVSWELFKRFPEAREGHLTKLRSSLVSTNSLAMLARELGISNDLRLGRGEESQGGRERDGVLSDALEAVLGAIFEDGGYAEAQKVITQIFNSRWPSDLGQSQEKDYKTKLQEATQRTHKDRPIYALQGSYGPEHAKCFEVRLTLPDGQEFFASGQSLKRAEQEAARMAFETYLTKTTVEG